MDTEQPWRLVEYYDVRAINPDTGEREDIDPGDLPECCRCQRRHAKVYVVERGFERKTVGSGCLTRAFGGWEPTKQEQSAARKAHRSRIVAEREAKADVIVAELKARIATIVVPEPQLLEVLPPSGAGGSTYVWGHGDTHIWVHAKWTTGGYVDPGLLAERRKCYERSYRRDVSRPWVAEACAGLGKLLAAEVRHRGNF